LSQQAENKHFSPKALKIDTDLNLHIPAASFRPIIDLLDELATLLACL
jgi:hypothetical protein